MCPIRCWPIVVMLPTPHGTYSRKEQSEREGEVGKSGRNPVQFLKRENREPLPKCRATLCPWCPGHQQVCPSTPWHLTWVCPSSHPRPQRLFFLCFPSTPSSPGRLVLSPVTRLVRCSEASLASGDAVIKHVWALPSQNLKSERERDIFKRQNTLQHTSQQDPLWPTSQNIGNKSKNKQMGPN